MFCRVAALAAAALGMIACTKPPNSYRVAVLRFEALSPDTGNDWVGRALSEEIAGQLEGARHTAVIPFSAMEQVQASWGARPVSAPGISTERSAAIVAGANRVLLGQYTLQNNRLSFQVTEEDVDKRKTVATFGGQGSLEELLHLADEVAKQVDDEAHPPLTGNVRALRSYALGLEAPAPQTNALFAEAIQLDPDFGKPYVELARAAAARGDAEGFNQIFTAARQRGNGIPATDRALLNLEDARQHASLSTKIDALQALVRILPADPFRLEELGTAELEANRPTEAADHYRKLVTLLPASSQPLNLLGYAAMYAGDEDGAVKALESYRRAAPGDANPVDSLGDARLFFGHFGEAEALYVQAHRLNPAALEGAELLKAAWAALLLNQAPKAIEHVREYQGERGRLQDALAPFRAAQVLRVAGRRDEADRLMQPYLQASDAAVRQAAERQMGWWRFFDGTVPTPPENSEIAQVIAACKTGAYQNVVAESRKLAENAPPTEWWTRIVYGRVLLGTGQTQEAKRFLRYTPVPQPTRALSLDEAWYPWILSHRGS